MDHPLLFAPADPLVQHLRELCLVFPESSEVQAWGRPTFRVGQKIFITAGSSMDRPHSMVFKPDREERLALVQDPRFFIPPYFGPSGWLATDFDSPDTDWAEIGELIETSYRQVALKRQLAALELGRSRKLI